MKNEVRRIGIICVMLISIYLCGSVYVRTKRPEKMTVEETVQWLMEYIYGEDYLALSTVYYSKEDGPRLPVYNSEWINCPIYEFELPNETIPIRRQIFCVGETLEERENGNPADENGDMIYDSRYDKFFSENALVYKDYYE